MESFAYTLPATQEVSQRAHTGVVGSGDLEIIIEPGTTKTLDFTVRTASEGFQEMWKAVFERFAVHHPIDAKITINDFGATPGVVSLRLTQAVEIANKK